MVETLRFMVDKKWSLGGALDLLGFYLFFIFNGFEGLST